MQAHDRKRATCGPRERARRALRDRYLPFVLGECDNTEDSAFRQPPPPYALRQGGPDGALAGRSVLLTYSSDFGAAHLYPCELRTVVPYTYTHVKRTLGRATWCGYLHGSRVAAPSPALFASTSASTALIGAAHTRAGRRSNVRRRRLVPPAGARARRYVFKCRREISLRRSLFILEAVKAITPRITNVYVEQSRIGG
ncbi:hypothetical protein EVAR_33192_1 [Eumeta japonica]|uniref:Uncharacterized protein n=1 Tax=Eumeta variegata TaxID=151549 RepID=A0A4C1W4T4_EUMVA|nr:hypothetical protein EVAR_33192_1 [Eumeta japonica]